MYHRILVPLDGSDTAERGLREATGLAAEFKATLYLLHVIDDFPLLSELGSSPAVQEMLRDLRKYGEELLAKARLDVTEAGVEAQTLLLEVASRRPADVIVEEARKADCDLIVMGTHGRRGFSRMVLGSQAELVSRATPVPLLLVRNAQPEPTQTGAGH